MGGPGGCRRSVPLRLIAVTKATHASADDYYGDLHHAEESLRAAQAAIQGTGRPVKVETAVVTGPPAAALIAESDDAALICVGSVGIGRFARSILASTATELAEKAHCPVAIIRPAEEQPRHAVSWIVVADQQGPRRRVHAWPTSHRPPVTTSAATALAPMSAHFVRYHAEASASVLSISTPHSAHSVKPGGLWCPFEQAMLESPRAPRQMCSRRGNA